MHLAASVHPRVRPRWQAARRYPPLLRTAWCSALTPAHGLRSLAEQGLSLPHIVVVPLSVLGNWGNELKKWCPSLKALTFHGNKDQRAALKDQLKADPPHVRPSRMRAGRGSTQGGTR